ncbi:MULTISPECIES: helix-turn-helix transcriptional regulator [Delftia]|uniref:Helix-turn-helix transcriptional regulator n=2 Tax=Delftia TaxID=80865 RepID=A0A7T2S263_DELAC|nr:MULTISPECIES: AraC family transcriptional regulator [Delftia]MBL8358259.1 helix-turn-helix transcriptional regulator [Delftia acidovorans]QPS07578.1 helix-turn-helix transcriptional regulator [Delftia acidovorans]
MFQWNSRFDNQLCLAAGCRMTQEPVEVRAPVFQGLQIIVALNSKVQAGVNGRLMEVSDAGVYLVLATGLHEGLDRYESHSLQRYVRIGFDAEAAERQGFGLDLIARSGHHCFNDNDLLVLRQGLSATARALATQILVCPYQGPMRDLFLNAKSLELSAAVLQQCLPAAGAQGAGAALSRADVERLWHAREVATAHFQDPLSLAELARAVGINERKLTAGFRQLFGMSVFEHLQQHRLEQAYGLLTSGGCSVTQVALEVGYSIAHFSTAFRRRFGIAPSELLR